MLFISVWSEQRNNKPSCPFPSPQLPTSLKFQNTTSVHPQEVQWVLWWLGLEDHQSQACKEVNHNDVISLPATRWQQQTKEGETLRQGATAGNRNTTGNHYVACEGIITTLNLLLHNPNNQSINPEWHQVRGNSASCMVYDYKEPRMQHFLFNNFPLSAEDISVVAHCDLTVRGEELRNKELTENWNIFQGQRRRRR